MKRLSFFFLFLVIASSVVAQDDKAELLPMKKFNIGIDVFTDIWMDQPEGMDLKTINRGANVFFTYNFQMARSEKWTFSPGLGIGSTNIWSNSIPEVSPTNIDSTLFVPIADGISYSNNKLTIATIDIPLELRYNPSDWHVAAYVKFRYNLSAHTKYKGKSLDGRDVDVKTKSYKVSNLEDWQIGVGLRVGYDWIHAFGYYSLTKTFQSNSGVNMYPISVGITFLPFK